MNGNLATRLDAFAAEARGLAAPIHERFAAAMREAEQAIEQARAIGLSVEVRHPMQARQTMLATRLRLTIPSRELGQ